MMKFQVRAITFALVACSQLVACLGEVTGQSTLEIGAGCSATDDCRPGLECEVEHGRGTCQDHGGSDGSTRSDASSSSGPSSRDAGVTDADDSTHARATDADDSAGARSLGAACAVTAECAAGLECDVEHGVSTCQPHGHGGRN
jgi:hypothetical protein